MLSQKSEHERVHDGVNEGGRLTGLTRGEHTLGAWWQGEQHAWAQHDEQDGRHDEIGLRQHETHGLRDQRIDEEEHERVEENGGATSETILKRDAGAIGSKQDTWAEGEEKGGWDTDFLRSDILKHVYIIFIL